MRISRLLSASAVLAVSLTCSLALAQDGPYKVLNTIKVGGDGGSDYVTADSAARRLYIARSGATAVTHVYDLDTFQAQPYINVEAGAGNEAHSIAVSASAILAASVYFQGKGHVIRRMSADIEADIKKMNGKAEYKTVEGDTLAFSDKEGAVWVMDSSGNTAKVTIADVNQSNGVIHVIDKVLIPKT